jgi:hypothetical protein
MQIIQRQFELDLAVVHMTRVRLVFAAAFAALRGGCLSLTALGRSIAERTTHKHGIKRVDRLLGNRSLQFTDRFRFYRAIARRVIPEGSRPIVIIDWTSVTPNLWALAAAVAFEGRAVTIYAEAHPISRYQKPRINDEFLLRLAAVLPDGCIPVVLADAGFRSPFMKLLARRGWDYVIRLRGQARLRPEHSGGWWRLSFLFTETSSRPKDFGRFELGEKVRYVARIVGVRRPVRHREYRVRTRGGVSVARERNAALQPWILATSLTVPAACVVRLYARRMQIEETFRDAKSPRFGMSLSHARTNSEDRANVLLLLASLAHVVAILLGVAAERAHLQRQYQANTVMKRVLSYAMLGRLVIAAREKSLLALALATRAETSIRDRVSAEFAG